jgi:endonuclease/exonuclease/phosphatase family metal-dependent hydrolase
VGNRHEPVQREQLAIMHSALARARAENQQSRTAGLSIIGGDFNLASDGSLYSAITAGGSWRDPFAERNSADVDAAADGRDQRPPVTTFRLECLPPGATAHRIDYLLVAGDPQHEILEHGLLFEDSVLFPDGRTGQVSDHLGVYCRVGISGSG